LSGLLAEGFLLGLSLGVTCLGTCLPVILPYLLIEKRRFRSSVSGVIWFLVGRFIGYIVFGAVAGALGGQIPDKFRDVLTGIAYIVLAVLLIYNSLRKRRIDETCPVKKHRNILAHPLLFGLILGFNPCPAFLLATSRAIESGGAFFGAIFFTGFFAGTSIFFLPFSIFGELGRMKGFRVFAKILSLAVAMWFVFIGGNSLVKSFSGPKQVQCEVVDPIELDTLFLSGDTISIDYFKSLVDKSLDADLIYKDIDSLRPGSFVVLFGPLPDTAASIAGEIGLVRSEPDSTAVEATANVIKTYGFKKRPDRGFFFEVKSQ